MGVRYQLNYIIAKNNKEWLYHFLEKNRHKISNHDFTLDIASTYTTLPNISMALIDFDKAVYDKARTLIEPMNICLMRKFFKELCNRTDYRLPYIRILSEKLGYEWHGRLFSCESDVELLARVEKLLILKESF
jgi:hypothetical protein